MNTYTQRSFTAGELDPALHARADMTKYMTGAATVRNLMVMRQGGLTNRPGTKFLAEAKFPDRRVKLIPFKYKDAETYMLEFGHLYFRILINGIPARNTLKNITAISTGATTVITTSTSHTYLNGEFVYFDQIIGTTTLNKRTCVVANATSTTFEIKTTSGAAIDSTTFGAYVSSGLVYRITEVVTPYAEADLQEIKYSQLDNVVTLTHDLYQTRELTFSPGSVILSVLGFGPSIAAPTGASVVGGAGSITANYLVTAVSPAFEESNVSNLATGTYSAPTASVPNTVTWTAVAGAIQYNIYKAANGVYGFLGIAGGTQFLDIGAVPDVSDTPISGIVPAPIADGLTGHYSNVSHYQQRRIFLGGPGGKNKIVATKIGFYKNISTKVPPVADDAIFYTMAGQSVNEVRHAVDIGALVVLTSSGEWATPGDSGLSATQGLGLRQYSYKGANSITPIVMGGNLLYVQARGSIIRDFGFDYQVDGYRGNDLTVFSAHLFDGYSISDWAYQQTPHSIVWIVRSDGALIGLTYLREHDIIGWHRHDTDGMVENVSVLAEGNEDVTYLVVKRTINGVVTRYIERMTNRQETVLENLILMDSTKTYDGRNTTATTMTLSGGTLWDSLETLTLTASASFFLAGDVGNVIVFNNGGDPVRFVIEGYTSGTVVTGKAHKTVPVGLRSTATVSWSKAVSSMNGLSHLEGKAVSVFADSYVVASPNNGSLDVVTVTNGKITLSQPYSLIHVGLPVTADLETLNVDMVQTETISSKKIGITSVAVHVQDTRGVYAGTQEPEGSDALEGLVEIKPRSSEPYDSPASLMNGTKDINIGATWESNGRVFIRQVDPLPVSILAVSPSGKFPAKGL